MATGGVRGDWEGLVARKPDLPAPFFVALGLWPAAAVLLQVSQGIDAQGCLWIAGASCAAIAAAAFACWRTSGRRIVLLILGCAIGCSFASWYAANLHAAISEVQSASSRQYEFTIVEDPQAGDFGDSCIAEVVLESGRSARIRVNLPEGARFSCWDVFTARCRLKVCSEGASAYYWSRGCAGAATIHSYDFEAPRGLTGAIGELRARGLALFEGMAGDGAALLRALVFGDRSILFASDFYGDVKAAGLAHIVAVSGAHLAVMAMFVSIVLQHARVPRAASILLQAAFIVGYVIFTGAPHSAIRSTVMTLCGLGSFFAKRRSSPLNALALCVILLLAENPGLALSISFSLSSCAVLGIILFSRYAGEWFDAAFRGRMGSVSQTFGMTCAANAFTMPISIATFGQFSLVSPLSNVIIVPVFAALCIGGMVCSLVSLAVPGAAAFLIGAASYAAQGVCDAISLCAGLPYACIPATGSMVALFAIVAAAAALIWGFWPKPSPARAYGVLAASAAALALLLFFFPGLHKDEIVMLDVGQGDAFVIRSGTRAILIDTGANDSMVLAGLARHDVRSLDAIVITHPDDDHCGSLGAVLDIVQVGCICVASDLLECSCGNCAEVRATIGGHATAGLGEGDRIAFGDFTCTVVSPREYVDEGGNADSVIMRVQADCDDDGAVDWRALFCGDAEKDVLHALADAGEIGDVDIYKVGHHGSKNAVDDELASKLEPEISLVSVGANNRYGHPTAAALDALRGCGSRVMRTDESGDVVCELSRDALRVSTVR